MAPASLNGPVPGLEEKESMEGEDMEWCKQCLKQGERNPVSYLQISDELAVLVCNDEQCTSLPTLAPGSHLVVERRAADIMPCRRRKRRPPSLQKRLDSTNPQSDVTSQLHPQGPMSAPISPLPPRGVIQWRNESNMCWLDVCMLLLVQFRSFRKCHQALGATSPLRKLCEGFDASQDMAGDTLEAIKKNLHMDTKSNKSGSVEQPTGASNIELQPVNIGVDLSRAGGNHNLVDNELLSDHSLDFLNEKLPNQTVCDTSAQKVDESFSDSVLADKIDSRPFQTMSYEQPTLPHETSTGKLAAALESLTRLRKELFEMLRPKLGCRENKEESPISALPTLLRLDGATEEHFNMRYRKEFYCFSCGFTNVTIHRNVIMSLASTSHDFSMQNPMMHHPCPQCKATGQTSRLIYHSLPACPLVHFTNGLSSAKDLPWLQPDFRHRGQQYNLSCVIQYKPNPNHFVIWIRDPSREQWMKCDGLSSPVCLWQSQEPSIPPSEIHIVGWERQNGNCHSCLELKQQMIHIQEALQDEPVSGRATHAVAASTECDVAPLRKRSCPVVVGRSASPLTISNSAGRSMAQAARNISDLSRLSPRPTEPLPASSILSIGTPPQSPEFQMPKTITSSESKDSIPSDECGEMQASGVVQDDEPKLQNVLDRENLNMGRWGRWERAVGLVKSENDGHESNRRSVASYLRNKIKNSHKPSGVLTGLLGNVPRSITKQQPDDIKETITQDTVYNSGTNCSVLQTLRSLSDKSSLQMNVSGSGQGLDKPKKPNLKKKPVAKKSEAVTPSVPRKIKKVRLPRPKISSFSAFKEKSVTFSGYLMAKDPSTENTHTNRQGKCSNTDAGLIQEDDFQSSVLLTPSSSVSSPSACSEASLQNDSLPAGGNDEIETLSNTMNALCKALDVSDGHAPQKVVSHSHSPNVDDDSFLQDLLR